MKTKRRDFIKLAGFGAFGLSNGLFAADVNVQSNHNPFNLKSLALEDEPLSVIGQYGPWAASLMKGKLPSLSYRNKAFTNIITWRKTAKAKLIERMGIPDIGPTPMVTIQKQYEYDGLHVEELVWQLPYGRPTEAILLKPLNAKGPLPGILAFHDHGGNKYFGTRKITRTTDQQHPLMKTHQEDYYENNAWANEIAKRGYVVLVSDAFPFGSRRVMYKDVPERFRQGLNDLDPEAPEHINAYNEWASDHESIMAKSLFSAGTTWPGVFFAEDQKALDVLCARKDVDANKIGCGGLSGGGMRTVFMGGLEPRIKCAVCVGFMTTWNDFVLNKSYTHTWMTYVPILPKELEFPEILGLRAPLPTLVLNDSEDGLYTLPEMKKADNILREVYEKAKAKDKYRCSYYPGPHKFDAKMQLEAFDWFDHWLK
ncbi:MAG: alpha/beta hydrolase family protein [Saprospiraceae bacterium]